MSDISIWQPCLAVCGITYSDNEELVYEKKYYWQNHETRESN